MAGHPRPRKPVRGVFDLGAPFVHHALHKAPHGGRVLRGQQTDVDADRAAVRHLVVLGPAVDRADVDDGAAGQQGMGFVGERLLEPVHHPDHGHHALDGIDSQVPGGGVRLLAARGDIQVDGAAVRDPDAQRGRLAEHGGVGARTGGQGGARPQAALEVSRDGLNPHVAGEMIGRARQRCHRGAHGSQAGLHVGDARAVDAPIALDGPESVQTPVGRYLVDVHVAVQQEAAGPNAPPRQTAHHARALPRGPPGIRNVHQPHVVEAPAGEAIGQVLGQRPLASPRAVDRQHFEEDGTRACEVAHAWSGGVLPPLPLLEEK